METIMDLWQYSGWNHSNYEMQNVSRDVLHVIIISGGHGTDHITSLCISTPFHVSHRGTSHDNHSRAKQILNRSCYQPHSLATSCGVLGLYLCMSYDHGTEQCHHEFPSVHIWTGANTHVESLHGTRNHDVAYLPWYISPYNYVITAFTSASVSIWGQDHKCSHDGPSSRWANGVPWYFLQISQC